MQDILELLGTLPIHLLYARDAATGTTHVRNRSTHPAPDRCHPAILE